VRTRPPLSSQRCIAAAGTQLTARAAPPNARPRPRRQRRPVARLVWRQRGPRPHALRAVVGVPSQVQRRDGEQNEPHRRTAGNARRRTRAALSAGRAAGPADHAVCAPTPSTSREPCARACVEWFRALCSLSLTSQRMMIDRRIWLACWTTWANGCVFGRHPPLRHTITTHAFGHARLGADGAATSGCRRRRGRCMRRSLLGASSCLGRATERHCEGNLPPRARVQSSMHTQSRVVVSAHSSTRSHPPGPVIQ
jgi:hypothetical protein